ncbi:glycerophosphodiester phosphodiesterase family protein [Roseibium salinum]|nr:glycerophosphodiester phosphodiesterase family protein [Roseibium salinum]
MRHAVIVCHRGACLSAPENTLASLAGAIDMGAEVVEFDVRPSRDGVLYVMHDATVDRTTDGTGRFADMTSDEIDTLDAGSWFSPEFAGERVPRLNTFLDACRGGGSWPMPKSRKAIRRKYVTCWPSGAC